MEDVCAYTKVFRAQAANPFEDSSCFSRTFAVFANMCFQALLCAVQLLNKRSAICDICLADDLWYGDTTHPVNFCHQALHRHARIGPFLFPKTAFVCFHTVCS